MVKGTAITGWMEGITSDSGYRHQITWKDPVEEVGGKSTTRLLSLLFNLFDIRGVVDIPFAFMSIVMDGRLLCAMATGTCQWNVKRCVKIFRVLLTISSTVSGQIVENTGANTRQRVHKLGVLCLPRPIISSHHR